MTTPSADEVTVRDVIYLTLPDTSLAARIYRPPGPGPFPAVVGVHGGRWCAEDRLTNAVIDHAVASAGTLVMAVDFRMPPQAGYPASLNDIRFAIRWLRANAAWLEVDPTRIGGVGASSGGHQIMVSALLPRTLEFGRLQSPVLTPEDADAHLDFVVVCWAVLDPLARYHMAKERNMTLHVECHDRYWRTEAAMAEANPQLILERNEHTALPPALLIHGADDAIVPSQMAVRFAETYRSKGGAAELVQFDDQPHTFVLKNPDAPASHSAIQAITRFIAQQNDRLAARAPSGAPLS